MKPENHHKIKTNARAESRVKMHLRQQLSWLWGYPIFSKIADDPQPSTLSWRHLYFPGAWESKTLVVDGQLISSTLYNRNKLIRDYPKALPRLINHIPSWSQHTEIKLDAIKQLIAGETVDPWQMLIAPIASARFLNYATSLKTRLPDFAPLMDQFAWWLSEDLEALEQALLWFESEAEQLTRIIDQEHPIDDLIPQLFCLHQKAGANRLSRLLRILQTSAWQSAYILLFNDLIAKYAPADLKDPPSDLIQPLAQWLESCLMLPKRALRQQLDALNTLFPETTIAQLEHRWALIGEIPNFVRKQQRLEKNDWAWVLNAEEDFHDEFSLHIEEIQSIIVPLFKANEFGPLLSWYGKYPSALKALERIVRAFDVEQLPENSPWSTPHLILFLGIHWRNILDVDDEGPRKKWLKALPQLTHFIEAGHDVSRRLERLAFIKESINPKIQPHQLVLDNIILHESPSLLTQLGKFSDAIKGGLNYDIVSHFIYEFPEIRDVGISLDTYINYIKAIQNNHIEFINIYDDDWRFLHTVAQGNPDSLIACLPLWGDFDDNDERSWESHDREILLTASYLYAQKLDDIATYFAEKKDTACLKQCGRRLKTYQEIKRDPPPLIVQHNNDQEWIQHYPDALHNSLKQLCLYHPHAKKVAEKHLNPHITLPERLEKEMSVLRQKIADKQAAKLPYEKLEIRLAKLLTRMDTPTSLSPAVTNKLNEKLKHAAYSGLLNHWDDRLQATLRAKLCETFGLAKLPKDSLGHPKHIDTLTALLELSNKTLSIAKKILHTRLGEAPWDLRDEPENQRFLSLLQQKGVNVTPWLEGVGSITHTIQKDGEELITLSIEFEEDPLEVFHMGNHFQTCLSAFNFNFFSVVANAADINKRVIYLRNDKKKIVGRCLFAINDHGHLLTFNPYSHLGSDAIRDAVNQFADDLATQMNTIRSNKGNVSTRVAHDWYDDQAEFYTTGDPDFVNDKAFKQRLLTQPLNKIQQHFESMLENKVTAPITIQHLLRLEAFKQRPELSLTLVDAIKLLRNSDREISLRMAVYLTAAGHKNVAMSFVKSWQLRYRYFYKHKTYYALPREEVELLMSLSPSLAYRALMKTREKSIRTNEQDNDKRRLFYLAQANEQLYKPKRALSCYEALLKTSLSKRQTVLIKAHIESLETGITATPDSTALHF